MFFLRSFPQVKKTFDLAIFDNSKDIMLSEIRQR